MSCLPLMLNNLDLDCIADVECQPSGKRLRDEPISPYSTTVDSFSHFASASLPSWTSPTEFTSCMSIQGSCKFYIHLQSRFSFFFNNLRTGPGFALTATNASKLRRQGNGSRQECQKLE